MSRRKKSSFVAQLRSNLGPLYWLGLAAVLAVVVYFVGSVIPKRTGIHLFLVQSGSMEPSIATGDLIVTAPERRYAPRDVITFVGSNQRVVTHRVVELTSEGDSVQYVTKGDANPSLDADVVIHESVLGRVVLTVPRMGFLVSFGRSRVGILLLIVIPASLIIYDEYMAIRKEVS